LLRGVGIILKRAGVAMRLAKGVPGEWLPDGGKQGGAQWQ
jgi:hypothetical protein